MLCGTDEEKLYITVRIRTGEVAEGGGNRIAG